MLGQYFHTIDTKGRVIIPAKYRDQMGDDFIVTKGLDKNLYIYAPDEWKVLDEKLNAMPIGREAARKMKVFFYAGACDVTVDKQGRITIPQTLRKHAGLTKDVVLAGMGNHLELWDAKRFEEFNTFDDESELAGSLLEYGI